MPLTPSIKPVLAILAFVGLGLTFSPGQTQQPVSPAANAPSASQASAPPSAEPPHAGDRTAPGAIHGTIHGTVSDQSGAVIAGAQIKLTSDDPAEQRTISSGADGQFSFADVAPGSFHLTVTAAGFATRATSELLQPGENKAVSIALSVAEAVTEVKVALTQTEVAEEEVKIAEKQRVLGVIPNFYVVYNPAAPPLNAKQKFRLAFRTIVDPATFLFVAGTAGVQQAQNHFAEYGQGAEGYAKRFGTDYADMVTGTVIGGAILPTVFKQDPRYFYKGTGSVPSRFAYAVANSVICKGDNRRWQVNYSNILGNLAAGGLSNLYYPEQDRNGAELTLENAGVGIAATAAANLFQEFLIRHLTFKPRKIDTSKTQRE